MPINLSRLRPLAVPLLLFFAVFAIHFISPVRTSFDSRWSVHTAVSLYKEGNADLNEYGDFIDKDDYRLEKIGDRYYTMYPVSVPLMAAPCVLIMEKGLDVAFHIAPGLRDAMQPRTDQPFSDDNAKNLTMFYPHVESFVASIMVALAALVIWLIARLSLPAHYGILPPLIFAFCTPAWSTASRALWQHGPSMLMLSLTLYILLRAQKNQRWAPFASVPLAVAFTVRPTNGLSVIVITLFVAWAYRRFIIPYLLWSLTIAVPFVAYNLTIYRSLFSSYFSHSDLTRMVEHETNFFEALIGLLISPSRGLLIFSPILLGAFWGMAIKWREARWSGLDTALAAILLLHWLLLSWWPVWWGGHSYGPRLFCDMIPYFIYFMIPLFEALAQMAPKARRAAAALLIGLGLLSAFVHFRGAASWEVYAWNIEPTEIDDTPQRLWDWSDPQFLR